MRGTWMRWWKRMWGGEDRPAPSERLRSVRLTIQGWNDEPPRGGMRFWRDADGDLLSLAIPDGVFDLPSPSDTTALQQWSRAFAESHAGGLIEVRTRAGPLGAAVALIYKRLEKPAYVFTGMLLLPSQAHVW